MSNTSPTNKDLQKILQAGTVNDIVLAFNAAKQYDNIDIYWSRNLYLYITGHTPEGWSDLQVVANLIDKGLVDGEISDDVEEHPGLIFKFKDED